MNPTPLCARIFRLQGRIFPRPSHGVPLLKGTHRGSASATGPHFSRPVAPSPRGIPRDARPPADGAAGAVPVRSRPRELRRSPLCPAGHQVPHTHLHWSVRAGRNKGLAGSDVQCAGGRLASFETSSTRAARPSDPRSEVFRRLCQMTQRNVAWTRILGVNAGYAEGGSPRWSK
jgi:hypothetical protein